jgi:hypothetical protein
MLAEADELGRVTTPVPALAKMAEVTLEEFEKALQVFLDPDPYSRTRDHEGRRIERLAEEESESGFRLLNHAKYRERRDSERRREQSRGQGRASGASTRRRQSGTQWRGSTGSTCL